MPTMNAISHRRINAPSGSRRSVIAYTEIRVCQNKTCKKQGSPQILRALQDLELEKVEISGCGCLGNCGSGPNVAVVPPGQVVRGIRTPAQAFKLAEEACNIKIDTRDILAIQLRGKGNELAGAGQTEEAMDMYEQAIRCSPPHGVHKAYSNLSLAALTHGDSARAREAALQAIATSPHDWTTAKIRAVEACLAMGDVQEAETWLLKATRSDPTFRSSLIFKELDNKLQSAQRQ